MILYQGDRFLQTHWCIVMSEPEIVLLLAWGEDTEILNKIQNIPHKQDEIKIHFTLQKDCVGLQQDSAKKDKIKWLKKTNTFCSQGFFFLGLFDNLQDSFIKCKEHPSPIIFFSNSNSIISNWCSDSLVALREWPEPSFKINKVYGSLKTILNDREL